MKGMNKMAQLRFYWKNGGMHRLVYFLIQLLLVYRVVYINVSKNTKIYIPCHVPK